MYDRGHRAPVVDRLRRRLPRLPRHDDRQHRLPDISASFAGSGRDALSWVLDGYFVVIAALLVPAGGLADRFGHKRVFLLGLAGFTAASLLCALAPSLGLLIAFRVLQGIGAAMIDPDLAGDRPRQLPDRAPRDRRRALGRAAAAAAAIGPTLGGALVDLSDWRLVFLVNLPLGVALVSPAAAACSSGRSATAACRTCPAPRCSRSAWR